MVRLKFGAIVLALVGTIIATAMTMNLFVVKPLANERDAWMNTTASISEVVEIGIGLFKNASLSFKTEREMNAVIRAESSRLFNENRRQRSEIASYVSLLATIKPDTVVVTATDTIIDGRTKVDFQFDFEGATVRGFTLTKPAEAEGTVDFWPINLDLLISRLKDGSWDATVETDPHVTIGKLSTYVLDKEPTWYEKNRHWLFAGTAIATWEGLRQNEPLLYIPAGAIVVLEFGNVLWKLVFP